MNNFNRHLAYILQTLIGRRICRQQRHLMANIQQRLNVAQNAIGPCSLIVPRPPADKVKDIHTLLISINIYLYINRRMYIAREHYLELLKQVETLTRDNQLLQRENSILVRELQEGKIRHYELVERLDWMEQQSKALSAQLANQSEANHCDLKGQMSNLNAEQRKLIETKFSELQCSSFQKYKVLEIKNRVNRLENHDLTSFTDKLKKVYLSCSDNKEQPSLKDLVKWVKTLAKEKGKEGKEAQTSSSWKQNKKAKN